MRKHSKVIIALIAFATPTVSLSATNSIKSELSIAPVKNNISIEYGLLNNSDSIDDTSQYHSIGLRYAYNITKNIIFSNVTFNDQFAIEAGVFYYRILGFQVHDDLATVLPVIATGRYNINIGEYFSPFIYSGVVKNFSNRDSLNGTRLALGGGVLINLGRAWAIRGEYGTDLVAAGAVFRL